jgi:D-alanyl-D-alanine carboxypeptidase
MTRSGSEPEDLPVDDRVVGYMKSKGGWTDAKDTLPYRGTSAGGGYSTVDDLAHFAAAITGNRLLDAEHTSLLTSGKVDKPQGGKYAYGFEDRMSAAGRSFGHGGGAEGMNGDLNVFPQSGYVVVVLANLDPPAAFRVSQYIANRLRGQR